MSRASEPASAVVGEKTLMVGGTLRTLTLKFAAPLTGVGFVMRPFNVPGFNVSEAGRLKMTLLPERKPFAVPSVALVAPMNPVPCTVTVAGPDPAGIELG